MLSYTGSQVLTLELFVNAIFLESIPGCPRGDGGGRVGGESKQKEKVFYLGRK